MANTKHLLVILAALAVSACASDPSLDSARQAIAAECGDAPLAPGWAIAFDGNSAYLSRADAIAIAAWRDDVAAYTGCTQGFEVSQ